MKSKLIRHQRILFEVIEAAGEIAAADLHERYEAEAEEPRSKRQRRHYLDKLEHYNLIASEGQTQWRRYRVRGDR
jgi:cell division control protein 6